MLAVSSQPLRTLPNKPERIYTNANFQWFLCNRIQAQQPSAKSISLQSCECSTAIDPPTLKDGRHFRRCKKNNTVLKVHNTMRDLLIVMTKAAGLTVRREPHGLLRDNKEEKPADPCIVDLTIDGIAHTRHAIDLTCPLSDSSWSSLTVAEKRARADKVGTAGLAREEHKKEKIGDHASQLLRDNDLTMEARCVSNHIHVWPIGLEGDGTPTLAFEQFF